MPAKKKDSTAKPGASVSAFVEQHDVDTKSAADLSRQDLQTVYALREPFKTCHTPLESDAATARAQANGGDEDGEPTKKRRKLEPKPCDCPPGSIACLNQLGHADWEKDDGGASLSTQEKRGLMLRSQPSRRSA